jgi:hypothetical protein
MTEKLQATRPGVVEKIINPLNPKHPRKPRSLLKVRITFTNRFASKTHQRTIRAIK